MEIQINGLQGEGKTTLAMFIANTLAKAGLSVEVLDDSGTGITPRQHGFTVNSTFDGKPQDFQWHGIEEDPVEVYAREQQALATMRQKNPTIKIRTNQMRLTLVPVNPKTP